MSAAPPAATDSAFKLLADNAPVMIWRADTTRGCDFFNRPWLAFTGRSYEQELGAGWADGVHPDDLARCLEIYAAAFDARESFAMDYRLRRHDGAYRWILDNGTPYYDPDGGFAGYFGSCIDITDRKEAEARLVVALAEKDALMRELFHRVKNNMQLVVSLLGLQGARTTDPASRQQLEDMGARVQSLALVQDHLYKSGNLSRIQLDRYLGALCDSLAVRVGPGITFTREFAPIEIPMENAAPLGLIVNELVSNSIRHAFPEARKGEIAVRLGQLPDALSIAIGDDGVGLAPDMPQGRSLGLVLVSKLADQVAGRLDRVVGPGTRYILTVPLPASA